MLMRRFARVVLLAVGSLLLFTGCYTKFYRPGMDIGGPYSENQLYNRYDSSAIDTTLTRADVFPDTYPGPDYYSNYGWNYWGRPRGYTRWGFDFYNFSPGYYHSYYGYYDYYGYPWWHRTYYNRPWYGSGGTAAPSEPPSQRGERRTRAGYQGGGPAVAPAPVGGGGAPAVVAPPPSNTSKQTPQSKPQGNTQKRNGKRRR